MAENVMKQVEISKVTVNVGIGQVGEDVEKAMNLLEKITGKEPIRAESKEGSKTFGLRSGLNIGAMVTLRGDEAREFVEKVVPAVEEVNANAFDGNGNFSFGISEYIDVPGVDYDADIGMMGFEVTVNLERPGYRIKKRNYKPNQIGKEHLVNDEEARKFAEEELGIEVVE